MQTFNSFNELAAYSGYEVFNSDNVNPQEKPKKMSPFQSTAANLALWAALGATTIAGKGAMPSPVKLDPNDPQRISVKNKRKR